jgi:hypothetical protein
MIATLTFSFERRAVPFVGVSRIVPPSCPLLAK